VDRAAAAYERLAALAETIENEWQFVNDLVEAYLPAIRALDDSGLDPGAAAAVDEAIAEIGAIADPHKAIDWLSTFPHIVALACGGEVDDPAGADGRASVRTDGTIEPDEPDDSPFAILRRGGR
jgi:hypothetical protein